MPDAAAAATEHFTGVGIGGETPLIDAVAVVLRHEFGRLVIDADQEVASRIQSDEALR